MKEKYQFVIILLVYRNSDDLIECIDSIKKNIYSCKILIINAFYDEVSKKLNNNIALEKNCDFVNIENKGYGYGNNYGIQYALYKYDFDFLIISNPDILVEKFYTHNLKRLETYGVLAPKIFNLKNKQQNPMLVYENKISEWLIYIGFKKNKDFPVYIGIGINKIIRIVCLFTHKFIRKEFKIYQPHGSFVIFSKNALIQLLNSGNIFDENIFLFSEESVLSFKLKHNNIKVVYTNEIVIRHKEDGSIKLSDISIRDELKKSNIYYYENYRKIK